SDKTLERIAQAACGEHVSLAVEIGPGRGALTEKLLERADRVVAIELDPELAQGLRVRGDRLEIVEANALDVDWSQWGAGVLAGNLPYYAATAIISKYVRNPGTLSQAVFLIQKEVADRIAARPGSRDYGYFSVECQFLAQPEYLFTVAPGAFRPPPKVDSAVIRLRPRTDPAPVDVDGFLRFASTCFRHKRKTLGNNLAGAYPREAYAGRPEAARRAEQLSVAELFELYRAVERVSV
ncbi:MAG TPA: 16S rRNA (adenine(1518)-N(6)/adenine(1519)-N(6))-dimethyltransferase RsmA, partial [Bryobacteraceae bacterium]|nr:16S rRNA (adenine(1518)-N(6)/adenine(1519)-N(6))-dimethyltransferase RsmA [Bryobacteraceae bacterium]